MKKLNKLFAILIAVLGVQTLSAQTDVTSTYLTNADFEGNYSTFWTGSERAIFQPEGWTVVRTNGNDSDMSILCSTDVANENFSAWTINDEDTRGKKTYWTRLRWGGQVWNWNGTTGSPTDLQLQQEMKQLPEGVYRLSADLLSYANGTEANNHTYLIATNTTTNRGVSVEPTINHEKSDNNWENKSVLIPSSGTTNYRVTLQCLQNWQGSGEYISGFDNVKLEKIVVSSENPVDLTAFVGTAKGDWTGASGTYSICVEHFIWGGTATGEYLSQIVTDLPMGLYEVVMYCASSSTSSRDNGGATPVDEGDTRYVTLSANNSSVGIPSYNRTSIDGDIPSYTLTNVKVTDGSLKLLVNINEANPNWIVANIKSLTYLGPDLSTYKEALSEALTKANNFDKTSIPSAMASQLESAISNGENVEQTMEALQQATEQLNLILNVAENSQALYTDLKNLITQCTTYAPYNYSNVQDEAQRTTFTTAITTANTNGNKATTVAELTEVYNSLEAARQTFVLVAYPTAGNSFDFTFKITNAEVTSANGWANASGRINTSTSYTGAPDNAALDVGWWTNNIDINQELTGLPDGSYKLSAVTRSDADSQSYIYIKSGDDKVTADLAKYGTSNGALGHGWEEVTTPEFNVVSGTITIGAYMHNPGATFAAADNFKLYRSYDATAMQSVLTDLLEEAKAIANASEPMNAAVEATLNSTIDATNIEATDPVEIDNMITALNEAIASAKASINDYAKLKKYIDITAEFTDVSTYQAKYNNAEYSSGDVETVRRELNVMRFDAASLIFPNNIEVTGWEGTMGGKNTGEQHWDGTTGDNATKYYDNNSWNGTAHSTTTNITLPAGSYVLKAALRSNANTTLRLTVLEKTVDVDGKGDQGYGIDVNGKATFAEDATYANDDKGRGWEWEFVKFELTEETTVTLKVECDYNGVYGWASFSDITLWMDDATYVTVYGDAVNAPLAEAKALVDTKPMGTAENEALGKAIALGEGEISTPAQLNTAVDALKTAVASANAWRNTYYTEKDKLVAALERFEADYNDAENGALDYMNKEHWETVIAKAQAAAEAKDDLTSHANLTTATNELTAALDAATVSVGEYAALKAAIDEANALASANIGDEPFQRPQSAADALATTEAQSVYDIAEADGEGVITKTTALEEAITTFNNTPLNAPGDAMFNVIINGNEGYKFNGRAVTFKEGATAENYSMGYTELPGSHYNQAIKFIAAEDLNCYYLSFEDAERNTYYIGTGKTTGFGTDDAQIRSTADQAKAIPFRIEPSTQDGIYYVWNTVINKRIGGNGSDNTGLYTAEQNDYKYYNFNLLPAAKVTPTLTISSAEWATLILPFNAALPEGVTAYSCEETDGESLTLVPAESIVANTPYLVSGKVGTYNFSGYGLAEKDSYTDGLFVGTYVDYTTTANSNTYVLQNGEEGVAFYLVGGSAQPKVKAYRCYMTYDNTAGAPVFRIGKGTTGIATSTLNAQPSTVIYDLMGRKVNTMEKGGMYIVNGKKVVIK